MRNQNDDKLNTPGVAPDEPSKADDTEVNAKIDENLASAISDANLLIKYNSIRNQQLDSGAVKDVLTLKSEIASGSINVETETAFWLALNALSNAAAPATPATIRLTSTQDKDGKLALAKVFIKAIQRYRRITFIFLLLAIILNSYWFVASRTLDNLGKVYTEIAETNDKINTNKEIIAGLTPKPAKTQADLDTLSKAKTANLGLTDKIRNLTTDALSHDAVLKVLLPGISTKNNEGIAEVVLEYLKSIIGLTILPLVLGGLGACVFVVRKIGDLVRANAYDPDTSFSFRLRIYLGCIAGLVAAQFDIFQDSNLSPLAFAFLAGYGIEIFFSALDRLVGAFGTSTPKLSDKA